MGLIQKELYISKPLLYDQFIFAEEMTRSENTYLGKTLTFGHPFLANTPTAVIHLHFFSSTIILLLSISFWVKVLKAVQKCQQR